MADERACLENIHSLLDDMEREQRSLLGQLQAQKTHSVSLEADNAKLVQKLQLATQRFELAVARASFAGKACLTPVHFVQRPMPGCRM